MPENETPRRSDVAPRNTPQITVAFASGAVSPVKLVAAYHPIAAFVVPAGMRLELPIGRETTLTLDDVDGTTVRFGAVVTTRRSADAEDRYELELCTGTLAERRRLYKLGVQIALADGPYQANELHETRKTFRVQPSAEQRHGLTLGILDDHEIRARFGAQLLDLSLTGLSTVVDPETEVGLASVNEVVIQFDACFFDEPLSYTAEVCYRSAMKSGVRYGLQFANQDSLDYKRFQQVLTQYVMRRQREILQGRAG